MRCQISMQTMDASENDALPQLVPAHDLSCHLGDIQSGAAANFGDCTYRQIWGPNVNNNIYILTHKFSSIGFE